MAATHAVTNQPPPLVGYDVFTTDAALVEAVDRYRVDRGRTQLPQLGQLAGSAEAQNWAREAEIYSPEWEHRLAGPYDSSQRPPIAKSGVLAGMAMTENQGGSDVRATMTRAVPTTDASWYRLTGHKWFCSAPMNDIFLMLAQAPAGLTCFVVPRIRSDGRRNGIAIQRLKNKLGNRANASAEIKLDDAIAQRLGPEGRGIATIIEMVAATRLDCVLSSTALMRRAVAEATWHAEHRSAFGARLTDLPLMRNVLADLAVESEAATALAMRLAASVDHIDDPQEQAFRRIGLPLAKYWVCKRTPAAVAEALECLGGNGYVEDSGMPRLYREAPLNSLWEGTANIQALDLLRVLDREPEALAAWHAEIAAAKGEDRRLDEALASTDVLVAELADTHAAGLARVLAGRMAALVQGSLLVQFAPAAVADAFCASRLSADHGIFGTFSTSVDTRELVRRTTPRK
jgi:putative acyl-CoA dehydrogenase